MVKAAFSKKKALFYQEIGLKLKKKQVRWYTGA
jgi:hypothetical protein